MIAGAVLALGLLASADAVAPADAVVLGARMAGLPEYAAELRRICRIESWGCRRIGIHEGHVERRPGEVFYRRAVKAGLVRPDECPAHAGDDMARWGIRGALGNAGAYGVEYIQPCAAPELLDIPLVSVMVSARRLHRLRKRHGFETAAERALAWRLGAKAARAARAGNVTEVVARATLGP